MKKKKKNYKSPTIRSEKLMTFGATCNGSYNGGRKATTALPDSCDSRKLLS